jgi:DNA-binding LacI/PurR family transcriptional regulator
MKERHLHAAITIGTLSQDSLNETQPVGGKRVNLKTLAEYLDLSPATISLVLNQSPVAKSIPLVTRQRVIAAAKKFNYRPNQLARSLRMSRTHTVGIIAPEHSDGYFTSVMMGVETFLIQAGYLYFTVSHFGKKDLLEEYPRLLLNRHVDGLLLINTRLEEELGIPTVAISGHSQIPSVTNILIDHDYAAMATLKHLRDLGHRRIAFMKGQPNALDAEPRWNSLMAGAQAAGFSIDPQLCLALEMNSWSPDLGYPVVMDLLRRTRNFTALVCFNDLAAIGAIRAVADCNLSCPSDLSIVGFDDIGSAGYCIPRLTTVRQPLEQMGATAAGKLIERIEAAQPGSPQTIYFAPELIVRESTAISRKLRLPGKK